jgi:N-acetylmuramoyl-L-alanine amidase
MLFISAGHNTKGKKDPGAVANGHEEANLTAEFRNIQLQYLASRGIKAISDKDEESLATYLKRIQTGTGSVVFESHFNAATPAATGIEIVIPERHTREEYECAKEMALAAHKLLKLPLRGKNKDGVITEAETARKSLALMRKEGINILSEICFITNANDLKAYFANKGKLVQVWCDILIKYDEMFK